MTKWSSDGFCTVKADRGKDLRVLVCVGGGGVRLRHEVNGERPSRKMEGCGDTLGRATSGPLFPSSGTCLITSFLFITQQQSSSQSLCMGNSGGRGGVGRVAGCAGVCVRCATQIICSLHGQKWAMLLWITFIRQPASLNNVTV